MKVNSILVVCVASLVLGAVATRWAGAGEFSNASKSNSLNELEGKWTLVTANMLGQPLLGKDQPAPEITIKDGQLTSDFKRAGNQPIDLTKALDPTKSPKIISLPVQRRFTFYGIYDVSGSELRICGGVSRGARSIGDTHPSDFSDGQGVLLVFKREK
jgi:uncharacterized protein (TIGR03067 family)